MKLYTEEQVKHAIKMARSSYNLFTTPFMYEHDEVLEQLIPIELPSDNFQIKDNIIELLKEDLECINKYLDDLKIHKQSEDGQEYSIVGRIKQLEKKQLQELSDLENYYLKNKSIVLPSDKEIEEMGKDVIVYNDTKRGWFVEGLKFMRDKIQGDNK